MLVQSQIVSKIEDLLKSTIDNIVVLSQREDYLVLTFTSGQKKYIAKVGPQALIDALALDLLAKSQINIPTSKLVNFFEADPALVITEYIEGFELRNVRKEKRNVYIDQIVKALNLIHTIKSDYAGEFLDVMAGKKHSWYDFLKFKYSNNHPNFKWGEIATRKKVDTSLVFRSLEKLNQKFDALKGFKNNTLIHCDINLTNVLVLDNKLVGIIDWSESLFGDPFYDFARFRMNIIQKMGEKSLNIYYNTINISTEEKYFENLYFICHCLDYTNWYSLSDKFQMIENQMKILEKALTNL